MIQIIGVALDPINIVSIIIKVVLGIMGYL